MTPSRFIPSHLVQRLSNAHGVVHWGAREDGRLQAMAFCGKAGKPRWNYLFRSEEQIKAEAARFLANLEGSAKVKEEYKARRKQMEAEALAKLAPGTILYHTWGYEQTNFDFYQVVRVLPRMIEVRPIAKQTTETGFMCGHTMPCKDQFTGPGERVKPDKYSVHDGRSVGVSWYG